MMTKNKTALVRVMQPIVLAALMLFSTPVFGLIHMPAKAPAPVVVSTNETVVFKNMTVEFKS
jgi:hypothetical protein